MAAEQGVTEIVKVDSLNHIEAGLTRLYTDLRVGALLLPNFISSTDLSSISSERGTEFAALQQFDRLFGEITTSLQGKGFTTSYAGMFANEHNWHLAPVQDTPQVRTWLHLKGSVELSFARTAEPSGGGYGFDDEWVQSLAYAEPIAFWPTPGDAVLFIDRGTPGVTGTSTFHKTEVPDTTARKSVACDTLVSK